MHAYVKYLAAFMVGGVFLVCVTYFCVPALLPAYDIPVLTFDERVLLYSLASDFDRACKLTDVDYCVVCGALLGMERHGDVIPWDDDLDVFMREEDAKLLFSPSSQGRRFLESKGWTLSQATNIWRVYQKEKDNVFLDVFPVWKTGEGNWVPTSLQSRIMFPRMFLTEDEFDATTDRQMGPVTVRSLPPGTTTRGYLRREYGDSWCRCKIMGAHTMKSGKFSACPQ